jgi:hypothetical protein
MISGELEIQYSTYSELAVYNFQETGSSLGPGGIWVEFKTTSRPKPNPNLSAEQLGIY